MDAVVEATATGFVMGTKLNGVAFALADGEQEQLNLREFGLRRADLFAVDATGTRIAFADDTRILVTDSRLQPMHDIVVESLRHGSINAITFTEDSIVTAGYDGGLYRWQVIGGRLRGLHDGWHSSPRTFFRLNPVAPWNLLVAEGGNVNYHYDIATLERSPAPPFLVQAGPDSKDDDLALPRAVGKFASSPYGRLAVYEGMLALSTRNSSTDFYSTVVQDLEHPLNLLMKPLSTLTAADADRVRPHLDSPHGDSGRVRPHRHRAGRAGGGGRGVRVGAQGDRRLTPGRVRGPFAAPARRRAAGQSPDLGTFSASHVTLPGMPSASLPLKPRFCCQAA